MTGSEINTNDVFLNNQKLHVHELPQRPMFRDYKLKKQLLHRELWGSQESELKQFFLFLLIFI